MGNNLRSFAKEIAEYSTSAERSNDLISNIEEVLGRELSKEDKFKLRMHIEVFISLSFVYTFSCLNIDEKKKDKLLSYYGKDVKKIFQTFRGWSSEQVNDYKEILNTSSEVYYKGLEGKTTLSQEEYEDLWSDFAKTILHSLNLESRRVSGQKEHEALLKNIMSTLANLHFEVKEKIKRNIKLFKSN